MAFTAGNTVESIIHGKFRDDISDPAKKAGDNVKRSMESMAQSTSASVNQFKQLKIGLQTIAGALAFRELKQIWRELLDFARQHSTAASEAVKQYDMMSGRILSTIVNSKSFIQLLEDVVRLGNLLVGIFDSIFGWVDKIGLRILDFFPFLGFVSRIAEIKERIDNGQPIMDALLGKDIEKKQSAFSGIVNKQIELIEAVSKGTQIFSDFNSQVDETQKIISENIATMRAPTLDRDLPVSQTPQGLIPIQTPGFIPETPLPEITWDEAFEQADTMADKMEVLANAVRDDLPSAFELAKSSMLAFSNAGVAGISTFFSTLFEGITRGELSFKKAAKAMLSTILSAIGTEAIARGSVMMLSAFATFPAVNGVMLAKGAALVALGGALKGTAAGLVGGGASGGGSGSGGGGSQRDFTPRQNQNGGGLSVTVNVNGNVLGADMRDFALTLGKEINKQISLDRLTGLT